MGFFSSLTISILVLTGYSPSFDWWILITLGGCFVAWIFGGVLSGNAKIAFKRVISVTAVVDNCPRWLKLSYYSVVGYFCAVMLTALLLNGNTFTTDTTKILLVSAFSMIFYAGAFAMLFASLTPGS